jgi:hypothetical protein
LKGDVAILPKVLPPQQEAGEPLCGQRLGAGRRALPLSISLHC